MISQLLQLSGGGMTIWDGLALLISAIVGIASATSSYYARKQYMKQNPSERALEIETLNKLLAEANHEIEEVKNELAAHSSENDLKFAKNDGTFEVIKTQLQNISENIASIQKDVREIMSHK